jgi:hypothetical protein
MKQQQQELNALRCILLLGKSLVHPILMHADSIPANQTTKWKNNRLVPDGTVCIVFTV